MTRCQAARQEEVGLGITKITVAATGRYAVRPLGRWPLGREI